MKSAFITGANRGLGKGFVDYLSSQGYQVFAGTRKMITSDKNNIHWIEIDVSDDSSITKAYSQIKETTNNLDLLINNAGVNKDTATDNHKELVCKLSNLDRKSLLTMFDINSVSPLIITKAFLPILTANPTFVINISSCRASYHDEFENQTGNFGYRASKTALNMLTFCSLKDLPQNIKTFTVHPGSVKSDMNPTGSQLPIDQAKNIISITQNWKEEFNGKFLRYSGEPYPL